MWCARLRLKGRTEVTLKNRARVDSTPGALFLITDMTESKYCDDFDYFRTKTSYLDEKVSLFSPEGVERGLEHDLLGAHNSAFTDAQSNIVDMLERDDDIDDILSAISDDFRSVTNDMNVEYSMDNLFVDAQYSPYHTSANQVMLFPK